MPFSSEYEAVIIGSGFGGAAMCARLSKRWPGQVLLLERGKAYPLGSFPRSPNDLASNFWSPRDDTSERPRHVARQKSDKGALLGMFDVRSFARMDTVTCAGLGGGSLIYANVFLRPSARNFEQHWPQGLNLATLAPYYDIAQSVLGARTIPPHQNEQDRRFILRTQQFQQFAASQQLPSKLSDIAVYFGHGYSYAGAAQPSEIGLQEKNRYGAVQTSCTYCGECDIGCNVHAKNTTDLNYLHAARAYHGAQVQTQARVNQIVPLNAAGEDDASADGQHGYRVYFDDFAAGSARTVTAKRVVVSAGTLGSNELLLRCRDIYRSLPRLSARLGQRFSGNGDFLAFALDGQREINSTYGPVITQYTDHHLFENHDPERAFLLEDASVPTHAGWAVAALQPVLHPWDRFKMLLSVAWEALASLYPGRKSQRLGSLIQQLLRHDVTQYSAVLLCMGIDKSDGRLQLNQAGFLDIDWPQKTSQPLYDAILALGERFKDFIGARLFMPMPNWLWPMRHNVTVHPLGGCTLADSPEQGVVSGRPEDRGQVFGYQGLYVADGAIVPGALGANPAATITALSEWIAHGITGQQPDDTLR
ncbi:GMC family oxidoreductase N-terminal domain-containing protein [Chitinimonas taiwanensis]|uniref:Cholesterol oxidase n=1 Tax=Chitinimonas taiwanensis DSM 18899 TaxID=1121279 RepID=A0A1K2HQP8_9NEIS|nr:GMC family oxidoreductase N-terminal domain-containing protein [Chitinimonas taiwanensis]SFZ79103.1 cholesterol oxidase [Chitinimonas taiwanensis DSM 18899]